jgi:hypothetical protein
MSNVEEFRLQPVLNLKSSLADMLEVEFAHLKVTHQNEVTRLEKLQRRKTEEMEVLSQQQSGPLDCSTIEVRRRISKPWPNTKLPKRPASMTPPSLKWKPNVKN